MFATHRQAVARALLIAAGIELPMLALLAHLGFPTEQMSPLEWVVMLSQAPGALVAGALGAPVKVAVLADGTPGTPVLTFLVLGASNVLVLALLAYLPVRAAAQRRSSRA